MSKTDDLNEESNKLNNFDFNIYCVKIIYMIFYDFTLVVTSLNKLFCSYCSWLPQRQNCFNVTFMQEKGEKNEICKSNLETKGA